jgi:hypothetical protein
MPDNTKPIGRTAATEREAITSEVKVIFPRPTYKQEQV